MLFYFIYLYCICSLVSTSFSCVWYSGLVVLNSVIFLVLVGMQIKEIIAYMYLCENIGGELGFDSYMAYYVLIIVRCKED
jgi:hypothetical protein